MAERRLSGGRRQLRRVPAVRLRAVWQIGGGSVVRGMVWIGVKRGRLAVELVPAVAGGRSAQGEG
jgi:hypothetical protein